MNKYVRYIKRHIIDSSVWTAKMMFCSKKASDTSNHTIVIFDTSIGTDNVGDEIIMNYCNNRLSELFDGEYLYVPLQIKPSNDLLKLAVDSKYKFICGTNLLYPRMEMQDQWVFGYPFFAYHDVCLLGVGWNSYSDCKVSLPTKVFYHKYLSSKMLHSVRDNYTKEKLNSIGISNVINTSCPSMWNLDYNHCKSISYNKANNVVTTLTDYSKDKESDTLLFNILMSNYKTVYLWLQGDGDEEYFKSLNFINKSKVILVPKVLSEYDNVLNLQDLEYVGTRLHAGIRALNAKIRTTIIGVDNRALEISKDTNLCVIKRDDIPKSLETHINSSWKTEIILPTENIRLWQAQFEQN